MLNRSLSLIVASAAMGVTLGGQGNRQESPQEFTNSLGMKFVWIRPGSFKMGREGEGGTPLRKVAMRGGDSQHGTPVHEVTLTKGFYLQVTEVTQTQWQAVMGERGNRSWSKGPDLPVSSLIWDDTQESLRRLNAKEKDTRYRMPTEAEWEYGCRAGAQEPNAAPNPGEVAWWAENSGGEAHPVGLKKPNAWGLYDMRGNVFEFVQDWYGPYSAERQVDPQGPLSGDERVVRGGWPGSPSDDRLGCSERLGGGVVRSRGPFVAHVGLRCARSL